MGRRHVAGADGGIGLERDADQAELQQSRPTGPAVGGGGGEGQGVGGIGRERIVHGTVSEKLHSCGHGVPPRWRSRTVEPVSRDRCPTSRQFRRQNPGFGAVLGFEPTCRNLWEIALRSGEIRGSVGWAVVDTATFNPRENHPCIWISLPRLPRCRGCPFPSYAPGLPSSLASRRRRTTRSGWSNALPGACRPRPKATCPSVPASAPPN